ncbi:MAG: hypothetical protein Q4D50_12195 [Eubacteriales bacterium]|nr:hypothetical protein [Eubacteriales bacterium]
MKWKASFRKLTALLLSVVLMLSLCTTAFATEGDGGEPVCSHLEGCTDNAHAEGCPLHQDPDDTPEPTPPTCNHTVDCAAGEHEDGCPKDPVVINVQGQINNLPNEEEINSSNVTTVKETLATIETAIANLNDAQKRALNLDKYDKATEVVKSLSSAPVEPTPTEPTLVEKVQAMINALPDTVTGDNAEDVESRLEAIDTEKLKLTDEELDSLDITRYIAAANALGSYYDNMTLDNVAQIGNETYSTVNAAIQAIVDGTAAGAIDVILSTNEDVQIPANANITLNLAENITLSNANSDTITNNGTLTVTGAGTIQNTTNGKTSLCNNGTAYLNGGSFVRADSSGNSYYTVVNHGTITVNGATISNSNTLASCVENGWYNVSDVNGIATLTVKSGTISGGLNAVKNDNASVLDIQGGIITNDKQYAIMNYGTAKVSGGQITCTAAGKGSSSAEAAIYNHNPVDTETKTAELTVTGGTLTSANHGIYNYSGNVTVSETAQIDAATYALYSAGNATVSDEAVLNGGSSGISSASGSKLTVTGGTITGTKYYGITLNKADVTISGGTIISNSTGNYSYVIRSSGSTVAITGGTFGSAESNNKATVYGTSSSKVIISGGVFQGSSTNIQVTNTGTNTVSISGGTYSSNVSSYVVDGNTAVQNENGTYSIGVDTSEDSAAVAEFNGYGYTSVQAAIDAAAAAGSGEVTLLKSTSENIVIPADTNITLNLEDGVTLANDPTSTTAHTITNNGTLTITGSGTVDNVSHAKAALYNNGTCTIENGTLTRSKEAGSDPKTNGGNSWYVIYNSAAGDLTINGGSVKSTGNFSSLIDNNNKLTITDGTFTNGMIVIKNEETGTLNISGGSFEATYYSESSDAVSAVQNWGNASISGGNFTSKGVGVYASEWDRDSTLAITGGTFTGGLAGIFVVSDSSSGDSCNGNNVTVTIANAAVSGNPHAVYVYDAETAETTQQLSVTIQSGTFTGDLYTNAKNSNDDDTKISVSGGTFSSEVAKEYCADGFYPNKNADGTYSVHVHNYGEPVFTWTDDNTCTVTTTCETCGDTLKETCTVTKETIAATATEAEKTVYTATATINGKTVKDTKTINGLAILAGQDQSYALYSGDTITIRCSGALGDFVSVSVDGKPFDYTSSNYTVKSGSTVLTFSNSYLNTLSVGKHTVTMNYKEGVYTDNSVSTTLTVTAGWEKLAIEVKANRTSVRPGKTITYTLTVTNNTGTDLTDIVVSNTVDKNLTLSSSSGSGTYTAKDGLWTISELKAGKTAKITVKYTVKSGVKDGTNLVYASAITSAEAANGETLPENVSPSGSVTVKVSNKISLIPGTGDTSNIGLWITVLAVVFVALVAVGIIAIIKTRKKK